MIFSCAAWSSIGLVAKIAIITAAVAIVGTSIILGLYYGTDIIVNKPGPTSPVATPTPTVPTDPVPEPIRWSSMEDSDYPSSTIKTVVKASLQECTESCQSGCDFVTYNANTQLCNFKYTDKSAWTFTYFKGQTNPDLNGELRLYGDVQSIRVNATQYCVDACYRNNQCQYVVWDETVKTDIECRLKQFVLVTNTTLAFRVNPRAVNYQPKKLGRFDVIGSSGIVSIHMTLMPNGKLLFTARPEYKRGSPNYEAVIRDSVPNGEIGTVFDPINGTFKVTPINDNLFCHGVILDAAGNAFTAGGDAQDPEHGLAYGLNKMRFFDYKTETWNMLGDMQRMRWYPSPIRLTDGRIWIFGGVTSSASDPPISPSVEIYVPGQSLTTQNQVVQVPLLQEVGITRYVLVCLVPLSGNVFVFTHNRWVIIDKTSTAEIERHADLVRGAHTDNWPTAACLLPLDYADNYKGTFVLFGGIDSPLIAPTNFTAMNSVARLELTQSGAKSWSYDNEQMPHGRFLSDSVIQPNGKILILNGAQYGTTGGDIALPNAKGAAMHCFVYDPYKPDGQRWSVLAHSNIQRLYHSNAVLLPDGRTIVSGTDQATYYLATSYEHRVEAFTPPWLLDGTSRPIITSSPSSALAYGATFTVGYSGTVTKASLIQPGSATHGVNFSQRMTWIEIVSRTNSELTLRTPPDATIMIQGFHMLFLLNNDTPSISVWIQLQ